MDKELEMEIVRAFGARLRGAYELMDQTLPSRMVETLNRLERAEKQLRPPQEAARREGGVMAFVQRIAPTTR